MRNVSQEVLDTLQASSVDASLVYLIEIISDDLPGNGYNYVLGHRFFIRDSRTYERVEASAPFISEGTENVPRTQITIENVDKRFTRIFQNGLLRDLETRLIITSTVEPEEDIVNHLLRTEDLTITNSKIVITATHERGHDVAMSRQVFNRQNSPGLHP